MKRATVSTKELHAIQATVCDNCGLTVWHHITVDTPNGYEVRCVGPTTYKPRHPKTNIGERRCKCGHAEKRHDLFCKGNPMCGCTKFEPANECKTCGTIAGILIDKFGFEGDPNCPDCGGTGTPK